jgi:hypothetical protein
VSPSEQFELHAAGLWPSAANPPPVLDDLFSGFTWIDVADKTIRTVAVYLTILILLRLAGKRSIAQLSTFDFVVILLLSNVVQNAIIGPDNTLVGGLIGAAVLIAVNFVSSPS